MVSIRTRLLLLGLVLGAPLPACGQSFADFGADEDACRRAGEAAIKGATGPEAAQRYDMAHGQCMQARGQMRWMREYRNGPGAPPFPTGNPDNAHYPEAFYAIPYATPGYGYDGFSPY